MSCSGPSAFRCKRCNTFLIDGSLSSFEQQRQMKNHLDTAHPYWDLEDLAVGSMDYAGNFRLINRSQQNTSSFMKGGHEQYNSTRAAIDRRQLFGIIGSILLFFGVFAPIISVPIVGSVNYFQNGKGDGVIVLILALISIGLVIIKKYRGLWFTGLGSLIVMLITFVNFQMRLSQMQDEMETKLAGNPFRGIADVAMQSIQIQWGWAVLVMGALFIVAAAAIRDNAEPVSLD